MFTESNTEGLTAAQIETLNAAFDIVSEEFPGVAAYSISDAINNAWAVDEEPQALAARVIHHLHNSI